MQTADVVIIGAGFAGASTAYHLVRRGVRNVVLLERESVPGVHASGRNAALAFSILSDPYEAGLALEGARFIAEPPDGFCSEPLFRRCGSLLVASAPEGMRSLQESERRARSLGVRGELLSPVEAMRRVPILADAPMLGAFWNPEDGVVDIHALLQGYLGAARTGGCRIHYRAEIRAVRAMHGRVEAVETEQETFHSPCVVNAAGGWAGVVGKLAGVGDRTLQPRRRHLFQTVLDLPIDPKWPFVWHNDVDTYFRPEGDGLLMSPCDATPHPAHEPQVDDAAKVLLAEKLTRAFPSLAQARIASGWACLRTFASDERFVIGRDPELAGFVWVGGLGGHGMTTSFGVGRLGAAAVLGDSNREIDYFSPHRLLPGQG
jgi:D-arginine dehydrogenase